MSDAAIDPHTPRDGKPLTLLIIFINIINHLGPNFIVTGAVIGAGELVLTSSLGAALLAIYFLLVQDPDPGRTRARHHHMQGH